ncbi:macro domain-containing protein [Hydrocarboniphaga effusa]|uniref:macro domain-containing protein n=1 Tax=Hydrocarboniphaga effusa TaxID=243629 RepID=UPI003137BA2E
MDLIHDLRTWRFWRHFLTRWFALLGGIFSIIQGIVAFFPASASFFQGWIVLLIVALASAAGGLIWAWPRPIGQEYNLPNTKISIVKGDILRESTHLVIGTCDTFDTETPSIIARDSLQGQVLNKLYGGNLQHLNLHLANALANHPITGTIVKPGKTDQYAIGTVATVIDGARKLFFLAYTEMDARNVASGSPDGVWKSLLSLWDEIHAVGNGEPVAIPVIGGGQARLSSVLPSQDSIRFIALSFMLASRGKKICDELRIVVRPSDYHRLDRLELQAFLSSLRAS